ncbi:hypothetical protein BD626DRAFT_570668 [Schizophyllum amplum]|uniref:Uncharacterized protein n=1 Tax=Schizophyllum amplum TaxID=97359 RepID=A0A550C9H1_9AGAR|nr:hypothetical protein BD626DRAFT_570668 [Auriculariopsis ampla]
MSTIPLTPSPAPPPQPLAHHRLRKETMVSARIASAYSVSDADLLSPTFPSRHASLMPSEAVPALRMTSRSTNRPSMPLTDPPAAPAIQPGPRLIAGQRHGRAAVPVLDALGDTPAPRHVAPRPTNVDGQREHGLLAPSRTLGARGSQIQIVLPAPLAPGAYPADFRGSMYAASDVSIADKWVPTPHRHDGIETGRQSSSSVGSLSTLSTASHLAPSFSYYSTSSPPTSRSPSNSRRSPSRSRSPGPSSLATSTTHQCPFAVARTASRATRAVYGLPDGGPRRAAAAPPGSDVGLSQV